MYKEFLDFATDIAYKIGQIQLHYFRGNNLGIETKSNVSDVVTRVDKECEELFANAVAEKYPAHKILGEEGGFRGNPDSDYLWVVDPLDGTTNFSQGLPIFTVSIALQYKNETIVAVVLAPYLEELYTATKGGGAFMTCRNGLTEKIHVAQKTQLALAVINTGFPYDKDVNPDNNIDNVTRIAPRLRAVREMGSAAYDLSCVACGILDGYWEFSLGLWDVCAGNLILEEAGGTVYYFRQNRGVAEIAGNAAIVEEMKKHIK